MTAAQGIRIGDWLRIHAQERPDAVFVVDGSNGVELTFREVHDRVQRLASSLTSLGLGKGDRIGVMSGDSHFFIEILIASMTMGATIVPLNTRLVLREAEAFLSAAQATLLFADRRSLERVAGIRGLVPSIIAVVAIEPDSAGADLTLADLIERGSSDFVAPRVDDDDIMRLSFTSGTTGKPKGVLQSHIMLKNNAIETIIDRQFSPETFHYNGSPLYHVSGFSHLLTSLAMGYRILTLRAFVAEEFVEWLSAGGLTHCFLVPTMVSTILQQPGIEQRDFSRVVGIGYGAAPMPPALLRRAMDVFGCEFLQLFGATEVGSQTVLGYEHHRRGVNGEEHLLGSIGKAAFNTEVRICDEHRNELGVGEIGEIVTRGDVNMTGYLDLPEETAAVMHDGWFSSGDMGYRDAEGFIYLAGRKKDMMIRGGENIYPIEIESVLFEFDGVLEAAVIGTPDDHWGELVTAFLVTNWSTDRRDELLAYCRGQLAPHKVPAFVETIDSLPKTSNGKIDKPELRRISVANRGTT